MRGDLSRPTKKEKRKNGNRLSILHCSPHVPGKAYLALTNLRTYATENQRREPNHHGRSFVDHRSFPSPISLPVEKIKGKKGEKYTTKKGKQGKRGKRLPNTPRKQGKKTKGKKKKVKYKKKKTRKSRQKLTRNKGKNAKNEMKKKQHLKQGGK